jgi:MFS family permease
MRGAAYGLRQSLDTIGAFLGPLAAFGLLAVAPENFRLVFALALIPGLLAVSLLVVGIKEPQATTSKPKTNPLRWEALGLLGSKYWFLLAIALLFNLGNSSDAFLLLRAEQSGIAAAFVPLTLVVMNIAYSLSAYPAGLLSDRLGRLGLLVSGFLVYAIAYLGFALVQQSWQVWGLFALYGLHLGLSQGILLALVADTVPIELRGTAFGFLNLIIGIALLPASLLAGYLWESFGPSTTFIAGSIFAAVAVFGLGVYHYKFRAV